MPKRLIFIHGHAQKQDSNSVQKLWYEAVERGLSRDFGDQAKRRFDSVTKDSICFGDLSNELLGELGLPMQDPTSRFDADLHFVDLPF